jgi:hypothetical protein
MTTNVNIELAIQMLKQKQVIKKDYSKKSFGLDLSLQDLAVISAAYPSAQQYGPKFQAWINHNMGWNSVPSHLGKGDSETSNGKYIEQKWGIRMDCGPGGMQHRFWQDIDYYLYGHIDPTDPDNITVEIFLLTHAEAEEESRLLGARATHGTKDANTSNKHVEVSLKTEYNSDDHKRWRDKYKITLQDLKLKNV